MPYDVTTITLRPATQGKALPKLEAFLKSFGAKGEFLGCLATDIGALNRILLIHRYANVTDIVADRERIVASDDPWGVGEFLTGIEANTYMLFPYLPAIKPGDDGPFYEVRDYTLKPNGLSFTLKAWEAKLPERIKLSPLTAAMYTVGGTTLRFTHIWPYKSLDERARIRSHAVANGIWPPPGGPDYLVTMQNHIFLPAPFSPMR